MQKNTVVVENNTSFSKSILWQLQRDYFEKEGVNAWASKVPNFVTSNTFIANCYANLVLSFFQDWVQKYPDSQQQPFYILELGTGTGQLSFYVLRRLKEMCKELNLKKMPFYYVMTDFTEANLNFWKTHPALQEFLDEGVLDFAIYNMENDDEIRLLVKGAPLSKQNLTNPILVFANYIFDTVAHDCFSVKEGKLREVKLHVRTEEDNFKNKQVVSMDKLEIGFAESDMEDSFYEEDSLNKVLQTYKETLQQTNVLIPISGIRSIAKLLKLSHDKLFLISSDKGYTSIQDLDRLGYPAFSFHGSFSMMVNFHSIAQYFKHIGGDYLIQTPRKGIKTCLFSQGISFSDLPATTRTFNQCVQNFSPADYFIIHRYISDTFQEAKLDTLVSHLTLTGYDPYMYHRLSDRICQLIPESPAMVIQSLLEYAKKIADNFYYTPSASDALFDIACLFYITKQYETALHYYKRSLETCGKHFGSLYNSAMCLYYMGKHKSALKQFKLAKSIDPQSKDAQTMIDQLRHSEH